MKKVLLVGGLCIAGLVTALIAEEQGKTDQQTGQNQAAAPDQRGAAQSADDEKMANASPDQKFVTCASRNNMFEIEAGKLVQGKADNDRVKKMAQMMIDDHTKAQDQLKQTAEKSKLQVPERLLAWQQAKLDHMAKMPAEDLQTEYSFHLVAAHHMAILSTQHALQKIQDQELKQLAQNTIKDLRGHLQHANAVAMQFTGGQGAGISGEPVSPNTENPGGQDQNKQENQAPREQNK